MAIPLNIGRRGLKPRKSINFFRMICAPRKKKPSATFFYRDGGRVSGVRCVWVRPAAGSVRMPCDRRCCRSAAALGLPAAECVVFEDAPAGIEAARRAGAGHIVALATTLDRAALAQTDADRVIDDFRDITDLDALLK